MNEHTTSPQSVVVPLSGAPYGDDFLQAINGFAIGGSTRCRDAIEEAGASVAFGALSGGDYTMVLAEKQPFEAFPALAQHIERMAVGGSVGSLIEWDAFLRELNAAIAAAPAPSSLAGGEIVDDLAAHLASSIANLGFPVGLGIAPGKTVCTTAAQAIIDTYGPRLAALSPEAPAREVEWFGVTGAADETEALAVALFDARCPGIRMTDEDLHYYRAAAQRAMKAVVDELDTPAITHRHETPAEGAGEREALAAIMHRNMIPDEDGGFSFHDLKAADQIMDYLRARSSAPEAREGEAVAWRFHYPDDTRWYYSVIEPTAKVIDVEPLFAHPAAPSADKLRIAVEALEPFANLGVSSGPDDEPCHYAYRITRGAIRNARQALAALATPDALKGDAK